MKRKKQSVMRKLLVHAWRYDKTIYFLCVFYTLLAVVVPLLPVALPKLLIGELTASEPLVLNVILITGGFLVAAGLFGYASVWLENYAYPRITHFRIDLVRDTAVKLLHISYKYTEDAKFSEDNHLAFEATSNNSDGIEGIYHTLFLMPAVMLSVLALAVFIGIKSVVILAALLVHVAVSVLVARLVQRYEYNKKADIGHSSRRVNYYVQTTQDFAYGKDIRLYNLKDRVIANFNLEISGLVSVYRLIGSRKYLLGMYALLTLLVSDVATYGVLTYLTVGGMSIADFSMYLTAVITLSATLASLTEMFNKISKNMMYAADYYRFHETDYGERGGDVSAASGTLEIEFKNVSFKYPHTDKNIITNLNLKIPKGQRLAIVGINGAGKTTLVKLMTGLFKVDSGEILINGVNVNDYDETALMSMFAVVFQDVNIFAFTIAENVACTSKNVDRERVAGALERVGMREKVEGLSKGMDTMMLKVVEEDGTEFSGGQNQKLAIARALYKDANAVIMDEPTSALDALAEAKIYEEFSDLVQGKTAIYISHRLASTKFCDKIALFDSDGLSEYGSHEELMSKGGKYHEMFSTQGKYYREGTGDES